MQSPHPKGEIFLGVDGYVASLGFKINTSKEQPGAFYLNTPERCFQFIAESYEDASDWVTKLKPLIYCNN